jgi:formamidopyrimidine-DNA glycosylase
MPELPEVESFRHMLLPLVSSSTALSIELTISGKPPKNFVSQEDVAALNNKTYLVDVKRKGKLIGMVLKCVEKNKNHDHFYMFLHMGMTGRISTPKHVPRLESLGSEDYPPKHTHIMFKCGREEASFSDPRKFGWVVLKSCLGAGFDELAPDALKVTDAQGLIDQRLPIKALLLDQKRVMCGVGNWVADEVLYHALIHPEQKYLSKDQAYLILQKTKEILTEAVECLIRGDDFPNSWLFHVRWSKRAATNGSTVKDAKGRKVDFITSGGRTSAIVPSIQKLKQLRAKGMHKPIEGTLTVTEERCKTKASDTIVVSRRPRPRPRPRHVADEETEPVDTVPTSTSIHRKRRRG